jgi:hypothetical protein
MSCSLKMQERDREQELLAIQVNTLQPDKQVETIYSNNT